MANTSPVAGLTIAEDPVTWIGWAQLCTFPNASVQGSHRDEFANSASCAEVNEFASLRCSGLFPRSRPSPT